MKWCAAKSIVKEFEVSYGLKTNLEIGELYRYSFDSVKGIRAIKNIIKEAGWKTGRARSTTVAIIIAAIALVGSLVAGVFLFLKG